MTPSRILVIYAHPVPHRLRASEPLACTLANLSGMTMHDLYRRYPDFDIDVRTKQEAVEAAELIVFQSPVQRYATLSLLEERIDVILEIGWTYGPGDTALRDRCLMVLTTTDSRMHSYSANGIHGHMLDIFLLPLQQAVALCGMQQQPPHVLHDADDTSADITDAHIAQIRAALQPWLPTDADAVA